MKVRKALEICEKGLKDCRIETYRSECIFYIAHLLGIHPSLLPLKENEEFDKREELEIFLKKRCGERIPLQHIIGEWDCLGRTFKVFPKVLAPRAATELLIETARELIAEKFGQEGKGLGLEVGTGTGCISINLLLDFPLLKMVGVEIDPTAYANTLENSRLHSVEDRLSLIKGDIFLLCPKWVEEGKKFDFIVSNPPYIAEKDREKLPPEVVYENPIAIFGGKDGTKFHSFFAKICKNLLREGGFMVLEFEPFQKEKLEKIFLNEGWKVEFREDFAGNPRVLVARKI